MYQSRPSKSRQGGIGMNVYTTDRIRNVVLLGQGGSGKTSLVEVMSYLSGITSRLGRVEDGNTVSDFDKEEVKRQFSISASVVPIIWEGTKINILDTPGYFDFVGEVEQAVSVADAAIIVVSGKSGIEVGTKKAWALCEKYKLPRMFFVTEMDIDNASYREIVEELTTLYGKKIAPLHLPIREEGKFVGYVNIVKKAGRRFIDKNTKEEIPIPSYSEEYLVKYREHLMEAVAETSEEFMDRYFSGEEFSVQEISATLRTNVNDASIIPVAMGSNVDMRGVTTLLDDIVKYFPNPRNRTVAGINMKTNEIYMADYDFAKSKSAIVFKTIVDPFIGKYSLIKVNSGVIKVDDLIYNLDKDTEEKLTKLFIMEGNKAYEVAELHAGDIGAIAKLSKARTGDSLSTKAVPIRYGKAELSIPYTYKCYKVVIKGTEDKVAQSLAKILREDLTVKLVTDVDNRQSLIYGMGDLHLDVILNKLCEKYKVDIVLSKPKVAFRETILKSADVDTKYKKQSGGHGQYGHVKMIFEPSGDLETSYVFEQKVVGGAVPKNYFPAIEKGIQDSVLKGPLAGYPVTGIKAILYDGSYHAVDSSEMAFRTAAVQAFKKGILEAGAILMEPIVSIEVRVSEKYTGDIMGDLNKKRGRVLGIDTDGNGVQIIHADIPMLEIYGYSTDLRSLTGGSGEFSYTFARYEQAPFEIQEKEIAAYKANGE